MPCWDVRRDVRVDGCNVLWILVRCCRASKCLCLLLFLITLSCHVVCVCVSRPGYYCPEGTSTELPCPEGRYGSAPGATSSTCTGVWYVGSEWFPSSFWETVPGRPPSSSPSPPPTFFVFFFAVTPVTTVHRRQRFRTFRTAAQVPTSTAPVPTPA